MLKQAVKIVAPLLSHGSLPKQPLICLQNQAKLLSTSAPLCEMRRYVPGEFFLNFRSKYVSLDNDKKGFISNFQQIPPNLFCTNFEYLNLPILHQMIGEQNTFCQI